MNNVSRAAQLKSRQRGVVLVVAMVIMTLVALLSLSALRASDSNVQVAANVQSRQEGLDSSQIALERVVSANDFFQNPAAVAAAAPLSIDVNGDQREDFAVSMRQPECLRARPVLGSELSADSARDSACTYDANMADTGNADAGVLPNATCSNTEWQLTATAVSPTIGASVTASQGVAVRVQTSEASTWCS